MKNTAPWSRRDFLKAGAFSGISLGLPSFSSSRNALFPPHAHNPPPEEIRGLDLSPARWIWFPSGRTLANSFFLFRKSFTLPARPLSATGWILADSRYLLWVNGKRVQWGPSPADPRTPEADPLDLADFLQEGENVIGVQVLFYGHGEGTWPTGKPGLIFKLDVSLPSGPPVQVVTDSGWKSFLPASWPWGQYKRWYLRALQEEFDARRFPYGWNQAGFVTGNGWLPAMEIGCPAHKPPIASDYPDYQNDAFAAGEDTLLLPRAVPMLHTEWVSALKLTEAHFVRWRQSPQAYFAYLIPDAFEPGPSLDLEHSAGEWHINLDPDAGIILTFEWDRQMVGWPGLTVHAPEGTCLEVLVHEAHDPAVKGPMNTHFHAWSRFVCKEGANTFEAFDYESFRWMQVHLHPGAGQVKISQVGVRRRVYPFAHVPAVKTGEPGLDRLFEANVNTLYNCAQETLVDGMGRERQQYSGDIGHLIHALHFFMNDQALSARFCRTYSQGLTKDGFFLDTWPAYDRLNRLAQRQLDLTPWGPLVDHGIGFGFDCWYQYLYSGDLTVVRQVFPKLQRFLGYLHSLQGEDGLLPTENLGIPAVWIDNFYPKNRHKQCALNLYAAAAAIHAHAPIARALGLTEAARSAEVWGRALLRQTVRTFWDGENWVVNLPWLAEEGEKRYCYRSISTAILFDFFPKQKHTAAIDLLVNMPPSVIPAYPANENWRLWALCKAGKSQRVIDSLRKRWANLPSVKQNLTLQEHWEVTPDSGSQWSHAPLAPLYVLAMGLAGLSLRSPGGAQITLKPDFGDLSQLETTLFVAKGAIAIRYTRNGEGRQLALELSPGIQAEVWLPGGRMDAVQGKALLEW